MNLSKIYIDKKMKEAVNNPEHYGGKDNLYEAIKVIEAWKLGFNLGNTVKYISRFGKKDKSKTIEDLKKAQWYLQREIYNLEKSIQDTHIDVEYDIFINGDFYCNYIARIEKGEDPSAKHVLYKVTRNYRASINKLEDYSFTVNVCLSNRFFTNKDWQEVSKKI